jgi:hypothetical protein
VGLHYGGELKYQEIAELRGVSVDHVGVLLHRALGKLRDVLNEKEQIMSRNRYNVSDVEEMLQGAAFRPSNDLKIQV